MDHTKKDKDESVKEDAAAGTDVDKSTDTPKGNPVHDLSPEMVRRGGVTYQDYAAADLVKVGVGNDAVEVNALALAAAGKTTGDRPIGEAERARNAQQIDNAVRAHASWLETQPTMTQMVGMVRPVIFVAGEGDAG